MTRAKDISKILTDANIGGTLDVSGAFTSQGIDDNADAVAITIDSSEDVTLSGNLSTGVNKFIDIRDADGHVSGRLRNVSGSNNALTIEADPDNSASSTFMSFKIDTSERMRIDSSGNLGLGATSVDTDIHIEKSSDIAIKLERTNSGVSTISVPSSGFLNILNTSNAGLTLGTNNTERMRIDSSGKVGIGTTTPSSFGSITSDLVVGTTSGEHGMTIASGTGNSGRLQFADNTSSPFRGAIEYAHSSDALFFYTSGTQRMAIQSNGRVNIGVGNSTDTGFRFFSPSGQSSKVAEFAKNDGTGCHLPVGSTAFTASSDETLKENITEFNKQTSYDDIKKMRAVTFNYKDWTLNGINYKDDKKRIGFIAQDWVTNYPEIIDKDQNDKLCMKYTETIPVLLSALQKAQEKIEAMEARITTLEGA